MCVGGGGGGRGAGLVVVHVSDIDQLQLSYNTFYQFLISYVVAVTTSAVQRSTEKQTDDADNVKVIDIYVVAGFCGFTIVISALMAAVPACVNYRRKHASVTQDQSGK